MAPPPVEIARHRTAIARNRLSAPMQSLVRHDFVGPGTTVLDYGCGQGDDVRALVEVGSRHALLTAVAGARVPTADMRRASDNLVNGWFR